MRITRQHHRPNPPPPSEPAKPDEPRWARLRLILPAPTPLSNGPAGETILHGWPVRLEDIDTGRTIPVVDNLQLVTAADQVVHVVAKVLVAEIVVDGAPPGS